jgi:hypothetical protein
MEEAEETRHEHGVLSKKEEAEETRQAWSACGGR